MNQVQKLFNYNENPIRTVVFNGEPHFIAKDVCEVLGLTNPTMALQKLDEDERAKFNLGRQGETNIVNEYGLYNLILTSRKPEAKQFKRWVTHEVLPTIRKHGAYMDENVLVNAISNPDFMIGLLENLKVERKARELLEHRVAEDRPKLTYYDTILASENAVNISQIAEDYGMSGAALNKILNEERVQYRLGGQWLLYSKYKNKGYTKSKTFSVGDGNAKQHTQWTQKGRLFIHELLTERGILSLYDRL
ncbi:phage antirepressor [Cytobacillus oceanisediminis]|uniref:Phage antirepressor n=1 Tax=Cytobacillus oceanisediminis 2691 TaxID=1196031 RepID=A0A160MA55_9BACI|nr:phage antirepressor [Cytobacillus oceanisediminis]AND39600.1 phage antirepressor [Cytobacillus oceanisediminis 2691]